jgi:hypothetical protein
VPIEWRTYATAIEAFFAENGYDVTSFDELVPNLLRELPVDWTLIEGPEGVTVAVALEDGACAGYDPDTPIPDEEAPPTYPPELTNPVSAIGTPCFIQEPALTAMSNAWFDVTGVRVTSQQELIDAELLGETFDLYDIDATGAVVQQFEGGCFLRSEELDSPFSDSDSACFRDAFGIRLATGLYNQLHDDGPPPLDVLWDRGYLLSEVVNYELVGDKMYPIGSLGCPEPSSQGNESDVERACAVQKRTIETAIDAYQLDTGIAPATMADLVPGYLLEVPVDYVLGYGADGTPQPVAVPAERCG